MTKRKETYLANKKAKVGESISCPVCGEVFTKKQYSQAFCCGECKDAFWNAKGDRHRSGYYEDYDAKHPERQKRRRLYGSNIVISVGGELTPRAQLDIVARLAETREDIETFG